MAENKIQLTKADRKKVCFRHQFLQGSWNYERMQNGGWCFAMIPAIKKLYTNKDDQIAALKRHLEFYNTHPYVPPPSLASPSLSRRSAPTVLRSTTSPFRASRSV